MAVLNSGVIESLHIENFIYHVIRHDLDEPSFNDEVALEQEQKEFFESMREDEHFSPKPEQSDKSFFEKVKDMFS